MTDKRTDELSKNTEKLKAVEGARLDVIEETLHRNDLTDEELFYIESLLETTHEKVNRLLKHVTAKIKSGDYV